MTGSRSVEEVRTSLALALASAVAEKGYAGTTIADVVAKARVSKRTFYEHFADKEECLMALYGQTADRLMEVLREAGDVNQPWQERVRTVVAAYLGMLEAVPTLNRALLVEMQAAGPRAYRMRQQTMRAFARTLVDVVESGRPANPQIGPLSPALALALVGGINELMLDVVDPYAKSATSFTALTEPIVALVSAVLAPGSAAGPDPAR
jgi:AcrR family transcriptional regulator